MASTSDKSDSSCGQDTATDAIDALIQLLEKEVALFDDNTTPLLCSQLNSFTSAYEIIKEDHNLKLSRQRLSDRARARDLLTDVFLILGPEVFLLCTFAITITRLSTIKSKEFIPRLRAWWASSPRPRGLTTTAADLTTPVKDLVSSARKRKFSDIGIEGLCLFRPLTMVSC